MQGCLKCYEVGAARYFLCSLAETTAGRIIYLTSGGGSKRTNATTSTGPPSRLERVWWAGERFTSCGLLA
jgi:hypothetical protein